MSATLPAEVEDAERVTRLRIVIVNYRTPGLTVDCLASLEPQVAAARRDGLAEVRVDLVEGGSGDGSAEALREAIGRHGWAGWVNLIVSQENRGFAGGNNLAIEPALAEPDPPDFVWLLNPDTVVRDGALRELLTFMLKHPDVGIAGSRLEDLDPPTPQRSAFRFPSVASEFETSVRLGLVSKLLRQKVVAPPFRDEKHQIDWVIGASMMVRREVFDAIGPLDGRYFMYYEELDFCLAANRAGYPCWYVPASRVVHLVGQASGVTSVEPKDKPRKRRPPYWFESRRRYFVKNHGPLYAAIADAAWIVGYSLRMLRCKLTGIRDHDPERYFRDFVSHSVFARGFRIGTAKGAENAKEGKIEVTHPQSDTDPKQVISREAA